MTSLAPRMRWRGLAAGIALLFSLAAAETQETIRVLSWDGYLKPAELAAVNRELQAKGYAYRVELIQPYAQGPEQMYELMRSGLCDVSFLTLFFIKLQGEKALKLIQAIDTKSPRLSNYRYLRGEVLNLPGGMDGGKSYYLPFGGGVYGFWADLDKVGPAELPRSFRDLLAPRWRGKYSLNLSQPVYNVCLALLMDGKPPFLFQSLIAEGKRSEALALAKPDSALRKNLDALYAQAGGFWTGGTEFRPGLEIVSSWGVEMGARLRQGERWRYLPFKEGRLVWLDTINFMKGLSGRKLEAAEIFANYCLGKTVQERLVRELSLFSVSKLVEDNPLLGDGDGPNWFMPAFDRIAENIMNKMSDDAMKQRAL